MCRAIGMERFSTGKHLAGAALVYHVPMAEKIFVVRAASPHFGAAGTPSRHCPSALLRQALPHHRSHADPSTAQSLLVFSIAGVAELSGL